MSIRLFFLLAGFALLLFTAGCGKQDGTDEVEKNKTGVVRSLTDKPLADYQNELLDLAFETVSVIPVEPHIKDRSRVQEKVVAASLELDQPLRALTLIEKIDNWRRGSGYADLAFYCARNGYATEARQYLNIAFRISETAEGWRRDQIRVTIAKTYAWLGQTQQTDEFEDGVVDSESGKVAGVKAMVAEENYFDEQMKALDESVLLGNFDIIKNTLKASANLFNRFYNDADRRLLVEEKIRSSWNKIPVFIRLEILIDLAEFALDHTDLNKALELLNEAVSYISGSQWPPEHRIMLMAKLSGLRFQAGEIQKARADVDALLALFDSKGDEIVDIYRAGALRPLA